MRKRAWGYGDHSEIEGTAHFAAGGWPRRADAFLLQEVQMSLSSIRRKNHYQWKKLMIFLFFIAYTVISFNGYLYSLRGEYFPVFSWSLFSEVRNPAEKVEVEIIRIGDTEFSEPVNYFDLPEYFSSAAARSTNVTKAALRLMQLHLKDPAGSEQMRRVFEENYLDGNGTVAYRLVLVRFDPLERFRSGAVIGHLVLAEFVTEEAR